jgi:hypothetical protein
MRFKARKSVDYSAFNQPGADHNIGVIDAGILADAVAIGVLLRSNGGRTTELRNDDIDALGLREGCDDLRHTSGREVRYLVLANAEASEPCDGNHEADGVSVTAPLGETQAASEPAYGKATAGMSLYDVFGSNATGSDVRAGFLGLQRVLGVEFSRRSSPFSNGPYLIDRETRHGEVRCINNVADDPCDVPYPEYEDYRIVVSVDYAADPDATAALIVGLGFEHLRRRRRDPQWPVGMNGTATPSEAVRLPI